MILTFLNFSDSDFVLSFETKVWEPENGNNKVITPTLYGIGYTDPTMELDFTLSISTPVATEVFPIQNYVRG